MFVGWKQGCRHICACAQAALPVGGTDPFHQCHYTINSIILLGLLHHWRCPFVVRQGVLDSFYVSQRSNISICESEMGWLWPRSSAGSLPGARTIISDRALLLRSGDWQHRMVAVLLHSRQRGQQWEKRAKRYSLDHYFGNLVAVMCSIKGTPCRQSYTRWRLLKHPIWSHTLTHKLVPLEN